MANMFDYLVWRGDLDFNVSPFNPIDNIIFSQLAYLTLDDIVPSPTEKKGITIELAKKIYEEKSSNIEGFKQTAIFKDDPVLIHKLGLTKRFGNCQLFGFINHIDIETEVQFSAITIITDTKATNGGNCYIAYRGTDSTIVGWKESFNMSFRDVIPSQIKAVEYLENMAGMVDGPICICGHSKGGNLAIYAASHCNKNIQNRLTSIYSNDGPGFNEKVVSSEGFLAIKDRIRSYVPQSSVIGMLLEHEYENMVIKSSQKGLMQHELYSWEVTFNDLVHLNKSTIGSRYVNKTLHEWMNKFDAARREQFIEAIYHILSDANVKSVFDIEASWFRSVCRIIKSLSHIEPPTRKLIIKTVAELIRSASRNIDTLLHAES